MKILVTGAAGFIGFHLINKLLEQGYQVIGFDNLNSYYDQELKHARLRKIETLISKNNSNNYWNFIKGSLEDQESLENIFIRNSPDVVINLAAQAGVRYSLENPKSYISSNIIGFFNILECCRHFPVKNLIYASSSSVYGGNKVIPFSEKTIVDHPVSLYAATKKSNELIAHTYSHLYNIPATGLRLFTVYGPWGRPDMAPMIFTSAIINDMPIKIYNNGMMARDFTYVDDIITCITKLINKPAQPNQFFNFDNPDPSESWCPHQIFNLGNSKIVKLMDFIEILENTIGKKAIKEFLPMQPGDIKETFADTKRIYKYIGYRPSTELKVGIKEFINWYKEYY